MFATLTREFVNPFSKSKEPHTITLVDTPEELAKAKAANLVWRDVEIQPASFEDRFEYLCRRHDLTFVFSDDHSAYQRGSAEYAKIQELARLLSHEKAVEIWNRVVDSKIAAHSRDQFYWK